MGTYDMGFHRVEMAQKQVTGTGTVIKIDGREMRGVTSAFYSASVGEIPVVTLNIIPEIANIDDMAEIGLDVDINSVRSAIGCIQMEIRLNTDFAEAIKASIRSVITEVGTKSIPDDEFAERIMNRVFDTEDI